MVAELNTAEIRKLHRVGASKLDDCQASEDWPRLGSPDLG